MRVSVEPRAATSRWLPLVVLAASVVAGFAAAGVIFAVSGANPFYAIGRILGGSFGSLFGLRETVTKAIPLVLVGSGLTLAYRLKFWNVGAEGQLLAGAMLSGWIGLTLGPVLPAPLIVPLMFLGGFLGGAVWGIPAALLRSRFGVNEVISTLMLNYCAQELLRMLIVGPWKGATQRGFPYTDDLPATAVLGLIPGSRIHTVTLVVGLVVAVILWVVATRTRAGYELRVAGESPDAARYAGIDRWRLALVVMVISGGAAGMAGAGEVAGVHHHLTYPEAISSGYGFAGIIVAWLGKLHPLGAVVSAVFLAGIYVGGDAIQISLGLPGASVQVFTGVVLLFVIAGDFLLGHRVHIVAGRGVGRRA